MSLRLPRPFGRGKKFAGSVSVETVQDNISGRHLQRTLKNRLHLKEGILELAGRTWQHGKGSAIELGENSHYHQFNWRFSSHGK